MRENPTGSDTREGGLHPDLVSVVLTKAAMATTEKGVFFRVFHVIALSILQTLRS